MKSNYKNLILGYILLNLLIGAMLFFLVHDNFTNLNHTSENNLTNTNRFDSNPKSAGVSPIRVAILNSPESDKPSYFSGIWHNTYSNIYSGLILEGINTIVITNADIIAGDLSEVDVLILIDNTPSEDASSVVKDWALSGGSIISFESSICFLNWAGLLPPEAEGTNGEDIYWDYYFPFPFDGKVFNDAHPVMSGYSYNDTVYSSGGETQYYSDVIMTTKAGPYYIPLVKTNISSNFDLVVALDAPYCGRIVHIWDQYHWNTASNRKMILNAINWVGIQVEIVGPVVAVLNSTAVPSYRCGILHNDYTSISSGLNSNGIDTVIIDNDDILSGVLYDVDVLILIDNLPNDVASLVVKDWALTGGSIFSFDSGVCFLNWAGLLPPEAEGSNGYQTFWDYGAPDEGKVVNDAHPIMSGYDYNDNIYVAGFGDSQYFLDTIKSTSVGPYYFPLVKTDLGSNYDLVVALDAPHCGRIVHIFDQDHWTNTPNQQMILNAIDWIRARFLQQTIIINEVCAGSPDFIELYNYGPDRDMTGWYIETYDSNSLDINYTFPMGWIFKSHQIVVVHEYSGINNETDLFTGDNLYWLDRSMAVGLFDNTGTNIDWFEANNHISPFPADAEWEEDISLALDNNLAYRIRDIDTDKASDWNVSDSGTEGSLNPNQTGQLFNFMTITGPIAIFRDTLAWDYNATEPILKMYDIPYTVYNSSDMGLVDLSPFQKVIIESRQNQNFYNTLGSYISWFENYALNGGILEIHACDVPGETWEGLYLMPGGLNQTYDPLNLVSINLSWHPIILNPYIFNDTDFDNWIYSAHGYFHTFPSNTKTVLLDTATLNPVFVEFEFGNGSILASMQPLEYSYYNGFSEFLVNVLLYDPLAIFTPSLAITTPNSISSWDKGNSHTIYWSSTDSISNVRIELYKDGIFEMEIISSTLNDGEYSWAIPWGLGDSNQYQIKIIYVSNPSIYNLSDSFEIFTPSLTIDTPNSTSSWDKGSSQKIYWTTTSSSSNVKIELYKDGIFMMNIISSTPNDGEYSWTIPWGPGDSSQYQIKIIDVLNPLIYDLSESFEIFTRSLTVTTPNSTSSWGTGSSHIIYWTSIGNISNVKIELHKDGAFEMDIISSTPNDGEFSWTIPEGLAVSSQYHIRIIDVSNTSIYDDSVYFEIYIPSSHPTISGYDILILLGALFAISVVFIKKRITTKR